MGLAHVGFIFYSIDIIFRMFSYFDNRIVEWVLFFDAMMPQDMNWRLSLRCWDLNLNCFFSAPSGLPI